MKRDGTVTRIGLVVLLALLALPLEQGASPVTAKPRKRTISRTFSSTAEISHPKVNSDDPVSANHYPSAITVRVPKGRIRDVNVQLNDFQHTFTDQVELLLVGPGGQTAIVMAHVGGPFEVDGVTLRLDDEAATPLPDQTQLQSGTFRPTNATGSVIAFNAPAPSASASAALSIFDGSNPNGTWRLFVQDKNAKFNPGAFADGWTLEIVARVKTRKKR